MHWRNVQAIEGLDAAKGEILVEEEWKEIHHNGTMHRALGLAAVGAALQNYSKPLR